MKIFILCCCKKLECTFYHAEFSPVDFYTRFDNMDALMSPKSFKRSYICFTVYMNE